MSAWDLLKHNVNWCHSKMWNIKNVYICQHGISWNIMFIGVTVSSETFKMFIYANLGSLETFQSTCVLYEPSVDSPGVVGAGVPGWGGWWGGGHLVPPRLDELPQVNLLLLAELSGYLISAPALLSFLLSPLRLCTCSSCNSLTENPFLIEFISC